MTDLPEPSHDHSHHQHHGAGEVMQRHVLRNYSVLSVEDGRIIRQGQCRLNEEVSAEAGEAVAYSERAVHPNRYYGVQESGEWVLKPLPPFPADFPVGHIEVSPEGEVILRAPVGATLVVSGVSYPVPGSGEVTVCFIGVGPQYLQASLPGHVPLAGHVNVVSRVDVVYARQRELDAERDRELASTLELDINGASLVLDGDPSSMQALMLAEAGMEEEDNLLWVDARNQYVELTKAQARAVLRAAAARATDVVLRKRYEKDQLAPLLQEVPFSSFAPRE